MRPQTKKIISALRSESGGAAAARIGGTERGVTERRGASLTVELVQLKPAAGKNRRRLFKDDLRQ